MTRSRPTASVKDDVSESPETERRPEALSRWVSRLERKPLKATIERARDRSVRREERPRTVSEAAEELGLSVHTVRAWVANRRIAHLRLGRAIRIPAAEIRRIIDKSTVPAVRED